MRFDIEIKYKNGNKICFYNFKSFKKKDNKFLFEDEDGFMCMERQDEITDIVIKMVESEDYGRFCCR